MSDCRACREWIESALAGQLPEAQRTELLRHAEACADCRALLQLHHELADATAIVPEPEPGSLAAMREDVLARIAGRGTTTRARRSFAADLAALWRAHPAPSALALAATLAAAVLLGHAGLPPWLTPRSAPGSPDRGANALLGELRRTAAARAALDDFWDTPYTLANVAVRPRSDGMLAMSFDVCRHVDTETDRQSPLAREVLLHAILEPSSLGSRFEAIALSPEIPDDQLKEALLLTLREDPSLAVRINTLATLARYPLDASIQDALVRTLRGDPEVQMRLLALEQLTSRRVDLERLRSTVNEPDFDRSLALLQRMTGYDPE